MQHLKGKLITFEGVDFAGKTTQIRKLAAYLDSLGIPNIVTHQPYDQNIRSIILSKKSESNLTPIAELLLYMADRSQHCREVILPNINAGKVVLCDRFVDSSVAYQGYGKGIDIAHINMLNSLALNGLNIDATIFVDVNRQEAAKRRQDQALDKMESLGNEFFDRVYNGFVDICKNHPNRVHRINGVGSQDEVHQRVIQVLEGLGPRSVSMNVNTLLNGSNNISIHQDSIQRVAYYSLANNK